MTSPDPATTAEPTVLLIEDEPQVTRFLRATLPAHGYRLLSSDTGKQGLVAASVERPDLILLDLGLPDMDGLEVTKSLREWTHTPIVVLSARGQEKDKVLALDAGADDYLTKPFGMAELLARIRVALRHSALRGHSSSAPVFTVGDLRVDMAARRVFVAAKEVRLTRIEYRLLTALVRYAGKVVTHRQLLREVWGPEVTESHYLRVYMGTLRKKLEADAAQPRYLLTETGIGYRLATE